MAQASGLDPSLTNLIGSGITVAVLAWYVIYDIRVRTPALLSTFSREQDELRQAFKAEQAGSRETFKQEQREARQNFTLLMDSVMKAEKEDRIKMREAHAVEVADWRRMVNDSIGTNAKLVSDGMAAFREAVHDVKNNAQAAIGQAELIAKKAGT